MKDQKRSPAWFLLRPDPELSLMTDKGGDDHFGVFKLLDGGCVMRLTISLRRHPMITLSASLNDHCWFEAWTYPREESAAVDFVVWEPGGTLICVECKSTRGGDHPPGNWVHHYPSHRWRIPIFAAGGPQVCPRLSGVRASMNRERKERVLINMPSRLWVTLKRLARERTEKTGHKVTEHDIFEEAVVLWLRSQGEILPTTNNVGPDVTMDELWTEAVEFYLEKRRGIQ